jgi:hypothetical protein
LTNLSVREKVAGNQELKKVEAGRQEERRGGLPERRDLAMEVPDPGMESVLQPCR